MLLVIDGEDAVFDRDAFTWESNRALYDILIRDASLWFAAFSLAVAAVCENDDIAAFWDVFFA